jgi:5-formyltetrahydrofolate cyclo-ligase
MDLKKELRLKFIKWMNENINEGISLSAGDSILNKLKLILASVPNLKVSIFISKLPEISTFPLIYHLFEIGAHVHLPAWHAKEMWMCRVGSKEEFDDILKYSPSNKIPMPKTNRIPVEVCSHGKF